MRRNIRKLQKELESISEDISNRWHDNPLARLIDVAGELLEWERDFIGETNTEENIEHCKYKLKER